MSKSVVPPVIPVKGKVKDAWCASTMGSFKFNTDGAVVGSFGPTGISGVLRNHKGEVLVEFSRSIKQLVFSRIYSNPSGVTTLKPEAK
ncbi:hypothetical protein V6N12_064487 [Hibiscus sabdariffa]|uniref:RNase H type-1 domain-containing protein n=1 Tax=Hibiscus sabdariffa TaxID=183260 RepID=A0ABR2G6G2_9ROSI